MIHISTASSVLVETLVVGDTVLSKNGSFNTHDAHVLHDYSAYNLTGNQTLTTINHIQPHTVDSLIDINDGAFRATPDHMMIMKIGNQWNVRPLYVAKDMVGNCSFMDVNGNEIPVTSAEELTGSFTVYDIDTEPNDTFYSNGILTHNHLHPNLNP